MINATSKHRLDGSSDELSLLIVVTVLVDNERMSRQRRKPGSRYTPPKITRSDSKRPTEVSIEDIVDVAFGCTPTSRPLVALSGLLLANMADQGMVSAACVDTCQILHYALRYYGVASETIGVVVDIEGQRYGNNPHFDGPDKFVGHVVLSVPDYGRVIDPTVQQFDVENKLDRPGMPVLGAVPKGRVPDRSELRIQRGDSIAVVYHVLPEPQRSTWSAAATSTATHQWNRTGAIIAGIALDLLNGLSEANLDPGPYPQLIDLLNQVQDLKLEELDEEIPQEQWPPNTFVNASNTTRLELFTKPFSPDPGV